MVKMPALLVVPEMRQAAGSLLGGRRGVAVTPCLSAPIPGGIWLGSGRLLGHPPSAAAAGALVGKKARSLPTSRAAGARDQQGFGPRLPESIFVVPWISPGGVFEWLTGIFS